MSKPTVEQLGELHEQIKAERVTRENLQAFLRKPNSVFSVGALLTIVRSHPFSPSSDFNIVEQDERSLALSEIDLAKVRLVTTFTDDETRIEGEENLRRLKETGYIRLDAKIFQMLWDDKNLIPEKWADWTSINFDGTILKANGGGRCVWRLCRHNGRWERNILSLCHYRKNLSPSAVLAV